MAAVPYHFTMDFVSRGNKRGRATSTVAKAAYNARAKIRDERTGEIYDFRRKGGLEWEGLFVPKNAPAWMQDRDRLWNAAEACEINKDGTYRKRAQIARTVDLALPADLTPEQQKQLLTDFAREQWQRKGVVAHVCLHKPHGEHERNWHAHVMLGMREVTPEGFGDKMRGDWKTREEWQEHEKAQLAAYRERWAEMCARRLEREGFTVLAERWACGHLTMEEQRAEAMERGDLEYVEMLKDGATQHRGPQVDAMERRGIETDRLSEQRAINERNSTLADLRSELAVLENEIRVTELEAYLDGVDRGRVEWDEALDNAAIEKEKAERRFAEPLHRREDIAEALGTIRAAYEMSDSAEGFRTALAERGMWLARADVDDVAESEFNHGRLEREGRYSPILEYGDYAAVDCLGRTFTLNYVSTGESRKDVAAFLSDLDGEAIPSIGATRAEFLPERAEQSYEAYDYAAHEAPERLVGNSANKIVGGLGKALDAAVSAMEGLFDYASPAAIRQRREPEAKVDVRRYLTDDGYRQELMEQEVTAQQQREREYYVQQKERER